MGKRFLEYDAERGLRIDYERLDDEGGGYRFYYTQDVEPLLESNKAKVNAGRDYYAADPDLWRVASIPIVVQYEWLRRYGVNIYDPDHMKRVEQLLNDPEWRYLKTGGMII